MSIAYDGADYREPFQSPPAGLAPGQVPQFVCFGFDDNGMTGLPESGRKGGLEFVFDLFRSGKNPSGRDNPVTFDGRVPKATFYVSSLYLEPNSVDSPARVKKQWHTAVRDGHEIGCHTHSHPHGEPLSVAQWTAELDKFFSLIEKPYQPDEPTEAANPATGPGIVRKDVIGFRTPYIEYNANTFQTLRQAGFKYDCSIEEGILQPDQDGTNYFWPYTLDNGSPGNRAMNASFPEKIVESVPGLWEIPCYTFMIPTDDVCRTYGIPPGLCDRLEKRTPGFNGRITGFDWNLWMFYKLTGPEVAAILKYTLDLRLAGNRCPFTVGAHSDIYAEAYDHLPLEKEYRPAVDYTERAAALADFFEYALSREAVRIVAVRDLLDWLRNPQPLC